MIKENILICGIVKNADKTLTLNINHALNTGALFENFKLIIYENNSTDNTKNILNNYVNNQNIIVIQENIDYETIKKQSKIWAYTEVTGSDHPCRIEQICNARNKVIDEINTEKYDNYTYVIWIDLDSNGWDINGIIDSFNKKDEWDVIYANGVKNRSNHYYDLYALRSSFSPFGPEIIGEHFWNNLKNISCSDIKENIPVYSAFGGIGIFKKYIFTHNRYDCIVNEDVKTFYRNYLKSTPPNNIMLNIIHNADTKFKNGYKDNEIDIFWKSNSGYDKPVVCEHVTLNFKLHNEGFRIFINPRLIYYSSH
jgi:hypothetical protein